MKMLQITKKYTVLLLAFFVLSCKQQPKEKSIGAPKDNDISVTKKDDTTSKESSKKDEGLKKEKSDEPVKSGVTKWEANPASSQIKFSVKGPFGTVHGNLSGLQSTILFDKDNLAASSIDASTKTSSISTGIKLRNKDLQKEKYLDAKKYPSISFRSDKIQKSGSAYKAIGALNIKGVSKPAEIPFTFLEKSDGRVFKGSFTINRNDYGIGEPGGSIGNNITVDLTVPVTKARTKSK
jgi:polyisoprenoid-binding protein YceI